MSNRSLIACAGLVHFVAAIFSAGYFHSDEHFQILELAGLKLGFNSPHDLAWEFTNKMRPAIQPALAYLVVKVMGLLGLDNPFRAAIVLRLLSGALGMASSLMLYQVFRRQIRSARLCHWFLVLSLLTWFMVYVHIRYSAESWCGSLFFTGLGLYLYAVEHTKVRAWQLLLAGLLLGLSFAFKAQAGLLIAGFALWLVVIKRAPLPQLSVLGVGFAISIVICSGLDRWFYGSWILSSWNYLNGNILENNLARFSQDPWWYYFKAVFTSAIPPWSVALIIGISFFLIRCWSSPITFALIPYLLVHMAIGHKELRFLFPLVNAIPVMLVLAAHHFNEIMPRQSGTGNRIANASRWFARSFVVLNFVLLGLVCFIPSRSQIRLFEVIYERNYRNLYVLSDNDPYSFFELHNNFYKRRTLNVMRPTQVTSPRLGDMRTAGSAVLAQGSFKNAEACGPRDGFRKIYQSLPNWLRTIKVTGWQKRTKIYCLYEPVGTA
ncbi:MAG: hypothetical protein HYX63_14880 [Gammaproteobacteria bacterium]|nr:hypothetical protein [Gammaproteobacteria bacterium]